MGLLSKLGRKVDPLKTMSDLTSATKHGGVVGAGAGGLGGAFANEDDPMVGMMQGAAGVGGIGKMARGVTRTGARELIQRLFQDALMEGNEARAMTLLKEARRMGLDGDLTQDMTMDIMDYKWPRDGMGRVGKQFDEF